MPDPGLVPIGTFAQAARVTVKALRHYHAVGVLAPAWVDPSTQYRYYSWDQLTDTMSITTLRDLGVSLERIRDHVVEGAPLHEILAEERARLAKQAADVERAITIIDALADQEALPTTSVDVVNWPRRSVIRARRSCDADSLGVAAESLIGDLLVHAVELGLDTDPPVIGEYPITLTGNVTFSVRLEVEDRPPTSLGPGFEFEAFNGGRLARALHVGPLESLPLAYRGLIQWMYANGFSPHGPVYERYLDDPASTPRQRLRTEVLHPLA